MHFLFALLDRKEQIFHAVLQGQEKKKNMARMTVETEAACSLS